jgi:hypothetical protein
MAVTFLMDFMKDRNSVRRDWFPGILLYSKGTILTIGNLLWWSGIATYLQTLGSYCLSSDHNQ